MLNRDNLRLEIIAGDNTEDMMKIVQLIRARFYMEHKPLTYLDVQKNKGKVLVDVSGCKIDVITSKEDIIYAFIKKNIFF